jgi:Fic family protein
MNIRKRSKGNKNYYYLEHSIRKGNFITKKEKYLGIEIPEDIAQIKKDFLKEIELDLIEKLKKINHNFNSEWRKIPESAKKRELEEIAIAFTYNTNAIEGSTITLEETRGIIHDKIAPNKSLRDIRETESHAKVFLKMLAKKEKISEELFLNWHKEIFEESKSDIAGRFRDYLVTVGSYLAPDWQDIDKLMKELIAFINKEISDKMNPVELSARVHYRFVKIHPFGDGNGRVGRLLMNYILWYSGYPMIIIEEKRRAPYYKALKKDEGGFLKYYIRRYLSVHKKRYLK